MIEVLEAAQAKKKAKAKKKVTFKPHRKGWSHISYEMGGALWSLNAPVSVIGAARRALSRAGEGMEVGDVGG